MIFFLSKKMDNLEKLAKLQKRIKAKTIDRKLTQLNFYYRTSKLFQQITNTIKKKQDINENLKILVNALNQQNLKTIEGAKTHLVMKALLTPGFLDYKEIYVLSSNINTKEYQFLKHGFEHNINKEILLELFPNLNKFRLNQIPEVLEIIAKKFNT